MSAIRDRIVELRRVPASELAPNPENWRTHPEAQRTLLSDMMAEIGIADAVAARALPGGGLQLIDGHLRRELLGDQMVPVLVLDVSEDEARKLLVSLDPLAAMAGTNQAALDELVSQIEPETAGLADLLKMLVSNSLPSGIDEIPEPPADPITRPGDLSILGELGHRLLCADSTDPKARARLLEGLDEPSMVVTDPPYGDGYDPAWRQRAAAEGKLAYAARRVGVVANDDRANWGEVFAALPSDVCYCWHAGLHAREVQASLEQVGYEIRSQIIWSKPHLPIGRGHYHWRHEPCWYSVRKGAKSRWVGDRKQTTVWEVSLDRNVEGGHSTQKPVELMTRAIANHDFRAVIDPFCGSGSTLVAAEHLGRRCYAMEIDPSYCDVIVARWEALTGEKAKRVGGLPTS